MKTVNVKTAQEFQEEMDKALVGGAELVAVQLAYPKKSNMELDMKRVILYVVLGAIVGVMGVLSVQAYNNYRHTRDNLQTSQAAVAAKVKANAEAQAVKEAAQKQAEDVQLTKLRQQCSVDHQLFIQTKGKSPNGDCDPSLTIAQ